MDIVLSGDSVEVRAYLAAQVGPSRRPFGITRTVLAPKNESVLLCSNTSGKRVLYLGVQLTGTASSTSAFAKQDPPSIDRDFTLVMQAEDTIADFVLVPGDQLYVMQRTLLSCRFAVFEVPF